MRGKVRISQWGTNAVTIAHDAYEFIDFVRTLAAFSNFFWFQNVFQQIFGHPLQNVSESWCSFC